jgi:hypothetical protein
MQQNDGTGVPATALGAVTWRRGSAVDPAAVCIEMAALPGGGVGVRSSADPDGPALVYTRAEIRAFILGAKAGEFDDLIG